jgi:hypothetical protein
MTQQFPDIQDVEFKDVKTENIDNPPNVVCDKHGEIGNYVFRVHMPEFGFENEHYCLVCVAEYLQMITAEVKLVPNEETEE